MNPQSRLKKLGTLALVASACAAATLGLAATAHADSPVNLKVDDGLRAELVQAGANLKGIPASEFVGLKPGLTYYAYDPDTLTYWAGARLVPSPTSERAQVSSQDAGAYTLFKKIKGGAWTAFNNGNLGEPRACPQALPASIVTMWGWSPVWCGPQG
jgi:hypothetical protein